MLPTRLARAGCAGVQRSGAARGHNGQAQRRRGVRCSIAVTVLAALELKDIVYGMCAMTEKQLQAVIPICGEQFAAGVRIAASLPRSNQVRAFSAQIGTSHATASQWPLLACALCAIDVSGSPRGCGSAIHLHSLRAVPVAGSQAARELPNQDPAHTARRIRSGKAAGTGRTTA